LEPIREGLERALSDRNRLRELLAKLDELLPGPMPLDYYDEDRIDHVLKHGLDLPAGELAWLLVDSDRLMQLWDSIRDEFPPYWQRRAHQTLTEAAIAAGRPDLTPDAIVRSIVSQTRDDRPIVFSSTPPARRDAPIMVPLNGLGEGSDTSEKTKAVLWTVLFTLTQGECRQEPPADFQANAARKRILLIERGPNELRLRLPDIMDMTRDAISVVLLAPDGGTLEGRRMDQHTLAFPPLESLDGYRALIDFQRQAGGHWNLNLDISKKD
jgi:hypothetical protein